jgi:hypothetical protein
MMQSNTGHVCWTTFVDRNHRGPGCARAALSVLLQSRSHIPQVHLPNGYHFGLTAATGDLADNHDILSFQVSDAVPLTAQERREIMSRIDAVCPTATPSSDHDPLTPRV